MAKYNSEGTRLESFSSGWSRSFPIDKGALAKAGFYYVGPGDLVQCAFCKVRLKNWERNDEPMSEHRTHSPSCPFVKGQNVGNIPLVQESRDSCKFPRMSGEQDRRRSLSSFPSHVQQDKDILAKAGFFYSGYVDSVQCFSCGGTLRSWQSDDNPWDEHAKHFPNCHHLRQRPKKTVLTQNIPDFRRYRPTIIAESSIGKLVGGEQTALSGSTTQYFDLFPQRSFTGSAEELHFRMAESQFYRLLSSGAQYKVVKVQYVVNPGLVKSFRTSEKVLSLIRGDEFAQPVLAFHGTHEDNINNICERGFLKQGDDGFHMRSGNKYGDGVYFSEFPEYSMRYIRGANKLLLCKVLLGKTFTVAKFTSGISGDVQSGFDSHTSSDGKELVIFDTTRILPCYIVHYG